MNKIELMGRLTKEVEILKSKKGGDYTRFTIAVPRKNNKEITYFIDVVAFGKVVDVVNKYVEKGNRIIVVGQLNIDTYTDKDGNTKKAVVVVLEDFYFVDFKAKEKKEETTDELSY